MADVAANLKDWSTTASNNAPSGTTAIGSGLDDNLRELQKVVRQDLAHKGADIASAATTDLGAVPGLFHDITGTATITSFGSVSAGIWKILRFTGSLTLTHNATSLILPGGANITTGPGDRAIVFSLGGGNWIVVDYTAASAATERTILGAAGVSDNNTFSGNNTFTNPLTLSGDPTQPLHAATKQYVDGAVPAGVVAYFAASSPPSGWLKANGAAVSRTTYAALFSAIGTTFGAGDGTTTFNLPDLRGEFIRGWDDGRGVDSGRAFGSSQLDAFQGHRFGNSGAGLVLVGNGNEGQAASGVAVSNTGRVNVSTGNGVPGASSTVLDIMSDGTNGTARVASETRPRNVALLACIKY